MTPKYRADIDGLRAIAVLAVIFFHSGLTFFSGGYVGVDIFFVISGYLITTIIAREIEDNTFSILHFYERRFRRILPPLVLVIVACFAIGFWLLTPKNLIDLGESAAAAALFSSNILFYSETGYFDEPAALKPLLHTWSLAVEEQYYILFPLLLMFISKNSANQPLRWLAILWLFSFVACGIVTRIDLSAAFYSLPTRAWELFMGSVLALNFFVPPQNRCSREVASVIGMTLIMYSIMQFTSETHFPGFVAILPTTGAALIIYAGIDGQSLVNRALSFKPLVFIGLISYSLYLWHWPILVYIKIYLIKDVGMGVIAVAFLVIFVTAFLSWRYIETPFRKKILLPGRPALLRTAVLVSLAIVGCGIVPKIYGGFPQRNGDIAGLNKNVSDPDWDHWQSCEEVSERIKNKQSLCRIGEPNGEARFILWGDSHARAMASGIDSSARAWGVGGFIATESACPPLLSVVREGQESCAENNNNVLQFISERPEIQTVILAARWSLSTNGTRYKNESGDRVVLVDTDFSGAMNTSNNVDIFNAGLSRTVARLTQMGKRVILVDQVPEIGFNVPASYFVAEATGRNVEMLIAPTQAEYKERTKEVDAAFIKIKNKFPVEIISAGEYLCGESHCSAVINNEPLYRDDDHLSTFGSKYLSKIFDNIFKDMGLRSRSTTNFPTN